MMRFLFVRSSMLVYVYILSVRSWLLYNYFLFDVVWRNLNCCWWCIVVVLNVSMRYNSRGRQSTNRNSYSKSMLRPVIIFMNRLAFWYCWICHNLVCKIRKNRVNITLNYQTILVYQLYLELLIFFFKSSTINFVIIEPSSIFWIRKIDVAHWITIVCLRILLHKLTR